MIGRMHLFVILAIGGILFWSSFVNYIIFSESYTQSWLSYFMKSPFPRLSAYCAVPENKELAKSQSLEGKMMNGNGAWKLHKLVIAIRHGDRTKLHSIPETIDTFDNTYTKSTDEYLEPSAVEHLTALANRKSIELSTIESSYTIDRKNEYVLQTLINPELSVNRDEELGLGHLTSRGYKQHLVVCIYTYINTMI